MTAYLSQEQVSAALRVFGDVQQVRNNRFRIATVPDKVLAGLTAARTNLGCDRLISISSADNGTTLELIYHLIGSHRTVISIATELPRENPVMPSMAAYLPPAGIYERQIHDLLGISFSGHPGLHRIILNEDWPENEYPLRKDWKKNPETYYGGIPGERV